MSISIKEVANTLNVSNYSLAYLCGNGHNCTNAYSKMKPLVYAKSSKLTDTERASADYGFLIPHNYSLLKAAQLYMGEITVSRPSSHAENLGNGWWYSPPVGTESSPYRLSDFVGYSTNRTTMFSGGVSCSVSGITSTETIADILFTLSMGSNWSLDSLPCFDDYHFGVILYTSNRRVLIADNTTSSTGTRLKCSIGSNELQALLGTYYDTYTIVPVLVTGTSNKVVTSDDSSYGIPLPSTSGTFTYTEGVTYVWEYEDEAPTITLNAATQNVFVSFGWRLKDATGVTTVNGDNIYFDMTYGGSETTMNSVSDLVPCGVSGNITLTGSNYIMYSSYYTGEVWEEYSNLEGYGIVYFKIRAYVKNNGTYTKIGESDCMVIVPSSLS